jgi:hypothetical protein
MIKRIFRQHSIDNGENLVYQDPYGKKLPS